MIEYRLIMIGIVGVCGLGFTTSLWPVLDLVITSALAGALVLAALLAGGREAVREIRFRREMRALGAENAIRRAAQRTEVHA